MVLSKELGAFNIYIHKCIFLHALIVIHLSFCFWCLLIRQIFSTLIIKTFFYARLKKRLLVKLNLSTAANHNCHFIITLETAGFV